MNLSTFDDYEKFTDDMAIYPDAKKDLWYPTLGLNGEAGEVAEKIKKILRKDYELTDKIKVDIVLELGDVLYYATRISMALNIKLKELFVDYITFEDFEEHVNKIGISDKEGLVHFVLRINKFAGLIGDKVDSNNGNLDGMEKVLVKCFLRNILYYITKSANALNLKLTDVVNLNVSKLSHRKDTDKVKGSGDHR